MRSPEVAEDEVEDENQRRKRGIVGPNRRGDMLMQLAYILYTMYVRRSCL